METTHLEALKQKLAKENELGAKLAEYCIGTLCSDCPLNHPNELCAKIKSRQRRIYLEGEIEAEKTRIKEDSRRQTREEMIEAMRTVKHDDWDIVNICYAEDDTTAVAFIKKGTELKPNMEAVRDTVTTEHDRIFKLAKEINKTLSDANFCSFDCDKCPLNTKARVHGYTCVRFFVRDRLTEIEKENRA